MSEEIIKVLDHLGQKFGVVADWASENVMQYVQDLMHRMVMYSIWSKSIMILCGIISLIISAVLIRYGVKKNKEEKLWYWEMDGFWIILVCTLGILIGIFFIGFGIHGLLESIFLPEKMMLRLLQGVE